jgi:hypothetical protein
MTPPRSTPGSPPRPPPYELGQIIAEVIEECALAGATTDLQGDDLVLLCETYIPKRFQPFQPTGWITVADWLAVDAGSPGRGPEEAKKTLRMVAERAAEKVARARQIKGHA